MGKKFKGMYMQKCGLRDGSLVPVTALLAQGLTDSSLNYHLQNAKNHGVTQKENAAVITHAAFYAGWPKAWAVFNLAKEVWETGEGDLPYEVCFYEHSCILLSASQVEHLDQEYPAHSIVCYHGYKVIHRSDQRT